MIQNTLNAAKSIAYRDVVLRIIPRSFINRIAGEAKLVVAGDAKTIDARRTAAMTMTAQMGVPADRVLATLKCATVEDIGIEELTVLRGFVQAIKDHEASIDDVFPAPEPEGADKPGAEGLAAKARGRKTGKAPAPEPEPDDAAPMCNVCGRRPADPAKSTEDGNAICAECASE